MNIRIFGKHFPIARTLILAGLSFSVLVFLFRIFRLDLSTLIFLDYNYLLYALLATLVFLPLSALRWYWILYGLGIQVPLVRVLRIIVASGPFALIPGRIGDFGRALALPSLYSAQRAFASVMFEKILDIVVLSIFMLFSSLAIGVFTISIAAGLLLIIVVSVYSAVTTVARLLPERVGQQMLEVRRAGDELLSNQTAMLRAAAASATNWVLSFVQVYFLFRAVAAPVSIVFIAAHLPAAIFIGLIPISLGGIGTRDSAIVAFFGPMAGASAALVVGVWYSLLSYGIAFLIGLPLVPTLLKRD